MDLTSLISKFGPYNKAIASFVMALLVVLDEIFAISFPGITEGWIIALLSLLNPVVVYLIPNKISQ